jgi:2-oxoglutarate dehydrogenase complex dehydrogenase (E1) component-like enzyme
VTCALTHVHIHTYTQHKQALAFSQEERLSVLGRILSADSFERFLAHKYATAKRYVCVCVNTFV